MTAHLKYNLQEYKYKNANHKTNGNKFKLKKIA